MSVEAAADSDKIEGRCALFAHICEGAAGVGRHMRALGSEHDAECRRGGDSPEQGGGAARVVVYVVCGSGAVVVCWRRGGGIWAASGVLLRRRLSLCWSSLAAVG